MNILISFNVLTLVQFVLGMRLIVVLFMHWLGPSVDGMHSVAQESSLPILLVSSVVHQHVVIASTFIFITLIASVVG